MNRKWMYMAVIAMLVASSAPAQKILAGDSGLTTPGGGRSRLDLSGFPIEQVFGARLDGSGVVSLKGESLGTGALDGIDTIVRRPADVVIGTNGQGTGSLSIVALRLVSEGPVSIGGKPYGLHVYLSEFRDDVKAGGVAFQMVNADGGTFNSSFNVRPKLVFTDSEGRDTAIDCGAVPCGAGDLKMTASGASFTISGVSGGMDPKAKGIKTLPAGLAVDGDGDGVAEVTTLASSNLFIGIIPSRPTFPPGPTDKYENSGSHSVLVPIPAIAVAKVAEPSAQVNGTFTPSNQ
jgi:hypothetical protein